MAEPINKAQLSDLRYLLGDAFEELISTFQRESQTHLKTILTAYEQYNNALGMTAAQALKGVSGNIGANELAAYCQKLIMQCKDHRLQHSEVFVQAVLEELHRVSHFLRHEAV